MSPGDPEIWKHNGSNGNEIQEVPDEVAESEERELKVFVVSYADLEWEDFLIMCPECDNGHVVHAQTWLDGATKEEASRSTRVCPYCGLESLTVDIRPNHIRNPNAKRRFA